MDDGWTAPMTLEEVIKYFDHFTDKYETLEDYNKKFAVEEIEEDSSMLEETYLDEIEETSQEKVSDLLRKIPDVIASDGDIQNMPKIEYPLSKLLPPILNDEFPILLDNKFFAMNINAQEEQKPEDDELNELHSFIFGSKTDKQK